ncbi:MAG: tryptophan 7-halogenase [Gammaproteobacteria bacterium]|nr:tryptophan 7-halogenase [Gammaproteobacteria bacterium]
MQAKRVLVVGGGSAGWTAAAYLNAALNVGNGKAAHVALVESPDVPRIGVGEATLPNINRTLAMIGIDELDFMKNVDATFKASIRFVNWLDGKRRFYHHPFSRFGAGLRDDAGRRWLMSDRSVPYMNTVSAQPVLCEMGLAPRAFDQPDFGIPVGYAFHMNALKYADYLRDFSTARGVTHHLEHVTDVETAEDGNIAALATRSGRRLEADLFIDCTGFASILIEKTLGVGWVDFSPWLLCDRALVMPVPYETHYPGSVRPHTQATALSAGWVWDIPLQNRRGVGYVHSSAFISEDDAERELRAYEGSHAGRLDTRLVRFKVGVREKLWHRNCVAMGLAGGFLEPLESTGLYLNEIAAELLTEHFPRGNDMEPLAFRFNRLMRNRYYEILDFINMHYCLTRRTDTAFWREVGRPERINDRLRAKLDFWRIKPPSASDFVDQFLPGQADGSPGPATDAVDARCPIDTGRLWNHHSYEAILYGMDFLSDECDRWFGRSRPRPAIHRQVIDGIQTAQDKLPPHDVWLKRMVGMPDYRA